MIMRKAPLCAKNVGLGFKSARQKFLMITLMSWNVAGLRAVLKKGFTNFLSKYSPDIVCLQEIKANPDQVKDELFSQQGYSTYWSPSDKLGYSGVMTLLKGIEPLRVWDGIGIRKFDSEGRVLGMKFDSFTLVNVYFPHGRRDKSRIPFKMEFSKQFLKFADKLKESGEPLVLAGDFNVAHKEVDIARPKDNKNNSGFLPIERAWADQLIEHGFVDTFRLFHKDGGHYTWWSQITKARERNIGWRIDYFFVTQDLVKKVRDAFILPEIMGSDHCPVGIKLKP